MSGGPSLKRYRGLDIAALQQAVQAEFPELVLIVDGERGLLVVSVRPDLRSRVVRAIRRGRLIRLLVAVVVILALATYPHLVSRGTSVVSSPPDVKLQAKPVTLARGQTTPRSIAVDDANVYWTNRGSGLNGNVCRVPRAGGNPKVLFSSSGSFEGLALDRSAAYTITRLPACVFELRLDATWSSELARCADPHGFLDCVHDVDRLYLAVNDGVWVFDLAARKLDRFVGQQMGTIRVAVDREAVYWTNKEGGTVMRRAKAGGETTVLAHGQPSPWGVHVRGGFVYWTNYCKDGSVLRVPSSGGTVEPIAAGQPLPAAVVADDEYVYWACQGSVIDAPGYDGEVVRRRLAGGPREIIASSQAGPFALTVSGESVFWVNVHDGSIMMADLGVALVPRVPAGPSVGEAGSLASVRGPATVYHVPNSLGHVTMDIRVEPRSAEWRAFEIKKLASGEANLVAYMSDEDRNRIETATTPVRILVFPRERTGHETRVDVPFRRLPSWDLYSKDTPGEGLMLNLTPEDERTLAGTVEVLESSIKWEALSFFAGRGFGGEVGKVFARMRAGYYASPTWTARTLESDVLVPLSGDSIVKWTDTRIDMFFTDEDRRTLRAQRDRLAGDMFGERADGYDIDYVIVTAGGRDAFAPFSLKRRRADDVDRKPRLAILCYSVEILNVADGLGGDVVIDCSFSRNGERMHGGHYRFSPRLTRSGPIPAAAGLSYETGLDAVYDVGMDIKATFNDLSRHQDLRVRAPRWSDQVGPGTFTFALPVSGTPKIQLRVNYVVDAR